MSETEKLAQIGEAALLLAQQKRDLAHLTERAERVRRAYSAFGSEAAHWVRDLTSERPGVALLRPTAEERDLPSYLLNHAELADLLHQLDKAKSALAHTRAKLLNFGITSI